MKIYRTKDPGERLNIRYVQRKAAYRIAARGDRFTSHPPSLPPGSRAPRWWPWP